MYKCAYGVVIELLNQVVDEDSPQDVELEWYG